MTPPLSSCEFCEIVAGRSPASVVYRDEDCIAFMDLRPVTAGHLLVVPIEHATHLADLDPAEGRALFTLAQTLAARAITNTPDELPAGLITFAPSLARDGDGSMHAWHVPAAQVASHVLGADGDRRE